MTAKELRSILEGVPDNTPVGIADHYGAMDEVLAAKYWQPNEHWKVSRGWVEIDVPYIGEEPE